MYWCAVYAQLTDDVLYIFEIKNLTEKVLSIQITVTESFVRKSDISCAFEINQKSSNYTFQAYDESSCNEWITTIKKTKLKYWKNMKEIAAKRGYQEMSNFGQFLRDALTFGYLRRYDKEKKTWGRFWFVLKDKILWFYKSELVLLLFNFICLLFILI